MQLYDVGFAFGVVKLRVSSSGLGFLAEVAQAFFLHSGAKSLKGSSGI